MHSLTEPVVSSAGEQAATISTTAPKKPHLHMAHLRPGLLPARSHQVCTKTILHQGRRNVGVRRYCGSAVESSEASILDPLGTLRSEAVVQTIARLCPRRHDGAAGAAPASPLPGNDVPLLLVRGLRRGFETRAPNAPRINRRLLLREIRPPLRHRKPKVPVVFVG